MPLHDVHRCSGVQRELSAPAKVLANVKVPAGTQLEPGARRLQVRRHRLSSGAFLALPVHAEAALPLPKDRSTG